jgi:hypothetical protein
MQVKKLDGREQTYKETEKLIKRLGDKCGPHSNSWDIGFEI